MEDAIRPILSYLTGSQKEDELDCLVNLVKYRHSIKCEGDLIMTSDIKIWRKVAHNDSLPCVNLMKLCDASNEVDELNDVLPEYLKVKDFQKKGSVIIISLDRPAFVSKVLRTLNFFPKVDELNESIEIQNAESNRVKSSCQMHFIRCSLASTVIRRLREYFPTQTDDEVQSVIQISCSDKKEPSNGVVYSKVGSVTAPFIDKSNMKATSLCVLYKIIYDSCREITMTRICLNEVNENTIHKAAQNLIKYQMLSTVLSAPCKVDKECSEMTTISYNYARIVHILNTFKNQYQESHPLPALNEIDFNFLQTDEEWLLVIMVNRFHSVIEAALKNCFKGTFNLHYITHYMLDLTNVFSKYYNSVKVLMEPLPQLLPTIWARIHLLLILQSLYDHFFFLFDLKPILNV